MTSLINNNVSMGPGPAVPSTGDSLDGGFRGLSDTDSQMVDTVRGLLMQALQQLQTTIANGGEGGAADSGGPVPAMNDASPASGGASTASTASGAPDRESSSADSSVNNTNSELESAMEQTHDKDPTLYAKTMKDAQSGSGNELVKDELQAYKEGAISKDQVIKEAQGVQDLANQNGGGRINKDVRNQAEQVLGGNYIGKGQTRGEHAIVKAYESFTPFGATVKGLTDKTAKVGPESIIQAGQVVTQKASQTAMQHMQEADPHLAAKFQGDAQKGDGNAMVDDLVKLKHETQGDQVQSNFSDQDAQMLGSQIGNYGKGKVNTQEEQKFTAAFGADTLYRGSTRGSKIFDKVESTVGGIIGKVVAPVTDSVGGIDKLVHGDSKGALKEFGDAFAAAAADASMVVAPEVAPEAEIGAIVAEGANAAVGAGHVLDPILDGARAFGKANDHINNATNVFDINSDGNDKAA